jgi:RNA-binding protein
MTIASLARIVSRLAALGPSEEYLVAVEDAELRAALTSFAESAGASFLTLDDPDLAATVPAAIVDLPLPPSPLVPARVKSTIGRVAPGGLVVVVIRAGLDNPQAAAQAFGPCFDLHKVHGERDGDAIVLRGLRRQPLERGRLKDLKPLAHNLPATVLIGREGLSMSLVAATQSALERHGLVKVRQTQMCKAPRDEILSDLQWATGGRLVSRIGRVAVLYRADVPLEPPRSHRG